MLVIDNIKNLIRHGKQAQQQQQQQQQQQYPFEGSAKTSRLPKSSSAPATNYFVPPLTDVNNSNGNPDVGRTTAPISNDNPLGIDTTPSHKTASASNTEYSTKTSSSTRRQHNVHKKSKRQRQEEYDAMLVQLVEEENRQKAQIPVFPGLEDWILMEKMGDGAFSNVYKAQNRLSQDFAAIKIVRKYELGKSQRATVLKEVAIMQQISHPNITRLLDFYEAPDYYYIFLELVPGGELFHQIVRLTYFSEDLSRHIIVQVAQAIRYLHEEKGVVHRDIKPENLLFYPCQYIPNANPILRTGEDSNKVDEGIFIPGIGGGGIGVVKIADFGLSKVVWDAQTMTPCGTVGYTAPEIVKDERYSKAVDMWALGCVLYTILCGFPPFYDESIDILTEKVARGQYSFLSPWWDEISKPAKDLVSHLLTVDPTKRYTIDEFLAHPWISGSNAPSHPAIDYPISIPMAATPAGAESPARASFSPVALSLREAFDVSYAVHRMEEENVLKNKAPQNLGFLNEEDEMQEEQGEKNGSNNNVVDLSSKMQGIKIEHRRENERGRARGSRRGGPDGGKNNHQTFELDLQGSTLLEKRRAAAAAKKGTTTQASLVGEIAG